MKINRDKFYSNNIVVLPFEKTVSGALQKLQHNAGNSKQNLQNSTAVKKLNSRSKGTKIFLNQTSNKINGKQKLNKKQLKHQKIIQTKEVQKMEMFEAESLVESEILPEPIVAVNKQEPVLETVVEHNIPVVNNENNLNVDDVIYIGRQDLQMIELYNDVQNEVLLCWSPPIGLPKDLKCTASFRVDSNGNISEIKIEKSSKALAYDMSVRSAIPKIKLPKQVWGKKISLEFTQG